MPRPVLSIPANIVRPSRSVTHRIVYGRPAVAFELKINWILAQQLENKLPGFRRQVFFGNQRHGLVAFATPSVCGRRRERARQHNGNKHRNESRKPDSDADRLETRAQAIRSRRLFTLNG
jgi:hypothetical protein